MRVSISKTELAGAIALAWSVLVGASPAHAQPPDGVRILTYNTAFVYIGIESSVPVGIECNKCNPLEFPVGPVGCGCSTGSVQPNNRSFADIDEQTRALHIAQRILSTDQDVVALQEVFNPVVRSVFITQLAKFGPYKHYVSRLRTHAPAIGILKDFFAQDETGFFSALQEFAGYKAVSADSGLMLFSKHPFLQLTGDKVIDDTVCNSPECEHSGRNNGFPLLPGFYAFNRFDDCAGTDCFSSKGVGLVKINGPKGPFYVAFTHLQADYPREDNSVSREVQLNDVRDTITGAIPSDELTDAQVYFAGDINIVGAPRTSPQNASTQEWFRFASPASKAPNIASEFFACGNGVDVSGKPQACRFGVNGSRFFTDSWGFQTSPTDRGISNVSDDARLDYIMHSAMGGRLCMQHNMIAWDLRADPLGNGGALWLSDHLPVRGDFNTSTKYCSPNTDTKTATPTQNVRKLAFGPTNCLTAGPNPACHQDEVVAPPTARIVNAGGFQWFVIDQAGTYSFRVTPSDPTRAVRYHVYKHDDLSRPIEAFDPDPTEWGTMYSLLEPPYYVRTFAVDAAGVPDRTVKSVDYTLEVHQHLCRSPEDACALEPGYALEMPYPYRWPTTVTGNKLTDLRDLWWRFKTSAVKGGQPVKGNAGIFPAVRMQPEASGDSYKCITSAAPTLEKYDDGMLPNQLVKTVDFTSVDKGDGDADDDGVLDDMRLAPDLEGDVDGELGIWFVKLTRSSSSNDVLNPCNDSITSYMSYHTNLTYVVPRSVEAWRELDDDIDAIDNIRLHMGFDEGSLQPWPSASDSVDINFDAYVLVDTDGYQALRGYYVNRVFPNLWEKDEGQHLDTWKKAEDWIDALSSWFPSETGNPSIVYADGPTGDWADSDYYYVFNYHVCHTETHPTCK